MYTEYQVIVGILLPNGKRLDYCREQVRATSDEGAKRRAKDLVSAAPPPPNGELFVKYIEVWEPRFRRVE